MFVWQQTMYVLANNIWNFEPFFKQLHVIESTLWNMLISYRKYSKKGTIVINNTHYLVKVKLNLG